MLYRQCVRLARQQCKCQHRNSSGGNVRVTLGKRSDVIIASHSVKKPLYGLTRPVLKELEEKKMSKEQAEVAEMLISENPLVWNLQDIASLFNLTYNSVSKLNIPDEVRRKQEISLNIYQNWSRPDQDAFNSYKMKLQTETYIKLSSQNPDLFQSNNLSRDQFIARTELSGLDADVETKKLPSP